MYGRNLEVFARVELHFELHFSIMLSSRRLFFLMLIHPQALRCLLLLTMRCLVIWSRFIALLTVNLKASRDWSQWSHCFTPKMVGGAKISTTAKTEMGGRIWYDSKRRLGTSNRRHRVVKLYCNESSSRRYILTAIICVLLFFLFSVRPEKNERSFPFSIAIRLVFSDSILSSSLSIRLNGCNSLEMNGTETRSDVKRYFHWILIDFSDCLIFLDSNKIQSVEISETIMNSSILSALSLAQAVNVTRNGK